MSWPWPSAHYYRISFPGPFQTYLLLPTGLYVSQHYCLPGVQALLQAKLAFFMLDTVYTLRGVGHHDDLRDIVSNHAS